MFWVIFILACIILVPIGLSRTKNKSKNEANVIFNEYINRNDLIVTKFIDIPTYDGSSKFFVDDVNKKVHYIAVKNNNPKDLVHKQFNYNDVIKCELVKDSKIKIIEDKFSIFDNFNQKEYVKKFGLRITFNDISFPFLDIYFINSMTGVTLTGLGNIINIVNEWIAIMNIVIETGKRDR